jgi:L-aminopeptidase/D-esterase-like protein
MVETQTGSLTDVPGLRVGHWTALDAGTGCTVILCDTGGAVAGVDVRGGAPGTRETDLLRPECTVQRVHAVVLAGGSAYGLAAADGVMSYLEEQGVGYDVGIARVPIVPAAVLFDLPIVRADRRPDAAAGRAACAAACAGPVAQGSIGAGCGATVGKVKGLRYACKGGLGSASIRTAGGLIVAALAVVNAYGNILDPATGQTIAGARRHLHPAAGGEDQAAAVSRDAAFEDPVAILAAEGAPTFSGSNTTLAVVATNCRLTKSECSKVAQMAHDGLSRAVRPVHSGIDGDVTFALSCGEHPAQADLVGALAADVVAQAIVNGVYAAKSVGGIPCLQDLAADTR